MAETFQTDFWVDFAWTPVGGENFVHRHMCSMKASP